MLSHTRRRSGWLVAMVAVAGGACSALAAFTVTAVPVLPGGNSVQAGGVNNLGTVVGRATDASGNDQPFVFRGGVTTALPLLAGHTKGWAHAVNNSDVIVGESGPDVGPYRAVKWTYDATSSSWTVADLGTLNGDESGLGVATDINDAGQIVGYVSAPANGRFAAYHAVFWAADGTEEDLGVLGFVDIPNVTTAYSQALGVSSAGDVAGFAYGYLQGPDHGMRRNFGGRGAEDVSAPERFASTRWNAINAGKTMVGFVSSSASITQGATKACKVEDGGAITVLPLPGSPTSEAKDINDAGQIVGLVVDETDPFFPVSKPFLFANGTMTDLTSLTPTGAAPLSEAVGISGNGRIAVNASTADGWLAYVLTPETTPVCAADYDRSGARTIDDIFVYLNDWFAGCTGQAGSPCNGRSTDVDNSGTRTIDDIFIFLNIWFAGCP